MGSRVYFGRLPRDVRERDIEKLLRGYGELREIHLRSGYGFVEFRDSRDADDAVYELHGRDFLGERIIVEHARSSSRSYRERPAPPLHTNHRLIVENVPSSASWQDLKDFMKRAGDVAFADCHKEREGEGVVEFHSSEDLRYALDRLQDAEFKGSRLRLIDASGGRGSRRSRSRSYSRSPPRRRSYRRSPSPRGRGSRRRSYSNSRSPRRRSPSRSPRNDRDRDRDRDRSPRRSLTPEKESIRDDDRREDGEDEHPLPRTDNDDPIDSASHHDDE